MKIKDLILEDRPRERLTQVGVSGLSTAELLALILRSGSKRHNVVEIAQKLLSTYDLKDLNRISLQALTKVSGIGFVKASQLVASFELARRIACVEKKDKVTIDTAQDVVDLCYPHFSGYTQEHFGVICVDSRRQVIAQKIVFIGTLNSAVVHPREIFQFALEKGAAAIILLHNHPSGNATPSNDDIEVTNQVSAAGELMEIEVLDHIIIGENEYYSFKLQEKNTYQSEI